MSYKAIIFDVDGTMLNTEKSIILSLQQALLEYTSKSYAYEDLYFVLGIPGSEALSRLGIEDQEEIMTRWLALHHAMADLDSVFDGIRETINQLLENNIVLGVATSRVRSEFDRFLASYGFENCFTAVSCAEDTKRAKPFPDPLLSVLAKLNLSPEEALYVGDSVYDMKCAEAAGVDGALALWGACEPEKIESCYRLESPEQILDFYK